MSAFSDEVSYGSRNSIDVPGHPWSQDVVLVDEIERQSGYDFLSLIESRVEAPP